MLHSIASYHYKGINMENKYNTLNLSRLEMENADVAKVVQSMINDPTLNRSDRRKIMKSMNKVESRERAYQHQRVEDNQKTRNAYQKELDAHIHECNEIVDDGLADNWKKMTALAGLALKRKYNWSNGRVGTFIEKMNNMHKDMIESGEWDDILKVLDKECDIQLEVSN